MDDGKDSYRPWGTDRSYKGGQGRRGGWRGRHHNYQQHGYHDDNPGCNVGDVDQDLPYRRGRGNAGRGRAAGRRGRQHSNNDSHDATPRERPPPELKGRDIGMWYASRSRKKTKDTELQNRPFLKMDQRKEENITKLLHTIRSGDNVTEQPRQSYADPSDETPSNTPDMSNTAQHIETELGSQPFDFNSDFVPFGSKSHSHVDGMPASTITRASQLGVDDSTMTVMSKQEDTGDRSTRTGPDQPGTSMVQSYFTRPSWMETEECSDDDGDLPDESLALTNKASEEEEDHSDESDIEEGDKYEPVTSLYKLDDDADSTFMTEFYQNKLANRRSFERLQDLVKVNEPLQQKPELDKKLQDDKMYREKHDARYKQMLQFRKKLPSYDMRKEILRVISSSQVTVLSGETGCGKTTQVSQFILDDYIERGRGSLCRIVCTQPRRISAISVAERVADERGETCGAASVGYQIRLEHKLPRTQGSILYCTTGIMLKWLVSDPWLSKTSHVILDEIHERDLHSDFLMIIMKDLVQIRPDIKFVLMSATLNAKMFSSYFGDCPMLNIPGFTYPVKEYLLEDVIEITKYLHNEPPVARRPRFPHGKTRSVLQAEEAEKQQYLTSLRGRYSEATIDVLRGLDLREIDLELVEKLICHIHVNKKDGAILVFLPGWDQISKLNGILTRNPLFSASSCRMIPLHSLMPTVNQRQVFERPPHGIRKIVIATNIAETSITIDDVVYVIDCGKIKMKNFDPSHNMTTLEPEWVSRANAKQRRGRAGRVQPGECYHLYTTLQETTFSDYQLPEILRTRLEELCLQIKLLRLGHIEIFVKKAMQVPSMEALHLAIDNLRNLNALDSSEELTPLGYHLAKMPVDPHTGKMLLFAAMFCCLDPILTIAASLSFKDAFYIPMGQERVADERRKKLAGDTDSDHIMLATAYKGWEKACSRGTSTQYCHYNFLSFNTLKMLKNMRKQFTELLMHMKFIDSSNPQDPAANKNSENHKLLKAIICAGLYPNVARIKPGRKPGSKAPVQLQSNTDRRIRFHPKSINSKSIEFESPWFVYHLKMKTSNVYLYDCSMVSPYPLLFFGGTVDVRKDHGQDCIIVDEWIIFRASRRISHLVKEFRVELDRLLEHKIRHPGITDWNCRDKEGALMHAILDLITTEEQKPISTSYQGH